MSSLDGVHEESLNHVVCLPDHWFFRLFRDHPLAFRSLAAAKLIRRRPGHAM